MKANLLVIFVLLLCDIIDCESSCGSWKEYKDEKCFKYFQYSYTFENAENYCERESASLVTIASEEELEFLIDYLFNFNNIVSDVWIGAKRKVNDSVEFKWIDQFNMNITNWKIGHPTNEKNRNCVQMNAGFDLNAINRNSIQYNSSGKWVDVPCSKENLVVCQKLQSWSSTKMQKIIFELRKELQNFQMQVKTNLVNLEQDLIPVNFTYVQLPNQPDPKSLWPNFGWKEATSEYAGLFFRAEGAQSESFGTIQEENAPRVTQVDSIKGYSTQMKDQLILNPSTFTDYLSTGQDVGDLTYGIRFLTSPGEVRPRNMAIRIWKRIE